MQPHPTFLLLIGTDTPSLLVAFAALAIPGFFIWKVLLKFLIKKGPRGINIAAAIIGAIQSPILALVVWAVFYSIAVKRENIYMQDAQLSAARQQLDSIGYQAVDITEIDVVKVSPDKCKVLMDNEYVRVLEYTLAPGEKDNPHTHPPKSYYVVDGGMLRVYPEKGQPFDAEEQKGAAEWGDYVGKHYVENIGTTTVKLLVTEVKAARF
jgi:beta-alanine degradation protein BauB